MTEERLTRYLRHALLILRITIGIFLLQWGVEKFVVPQSTVAIWGHFYGLNVSATLSYVFGVVEIVLAICLFLGLFRTIAYGAVAALHAVSVVVSWRYLLDPWGTEFNHLFIASVPVLGAMVALFLLRHWDRGVFETRQATV
jgi:putative oxidoreductase